MIALLAYIVGVACGIVVGILGFLIWLERTR